jgi:hypothetical protein
VRQRTTRLLLAAALAAGAVASVGTASGAAPRAGGNSYATYTGGTLGKDAGEPSISVNWKTGAVFLQAGTETDKVVFDAAGNATWSDVTSSTTGFITLDPIAASDNATGRIFVSQLAGFGSLMAYSDDDGATWSTSQGSGVPAGADHQTLGAGPYPGEGGKGSLTTYPNAVYYCSQELGTAFCARSDTGGLTFGAGVPAYSLADCGGLHGHVRVGPEGTVYLPNKSCLGKQGVIVSADSGLTWKVKTVPGTTAGKNGDPSLATGRDGTAYFSYVNGDGTIQVSVSRDKGTTWTTGYDVGAQVGVVNAAFAEAIAGDGDRAAVAFLGTKTAGNAQDQWFGMNPSHTVYTGGEYHLYVATTYDRGRTWKTVDVTPKDPVQRGRICLGGTVACDVKDRNLLDFMDIQVGRDGRVLVGWPDGCVLACVSSDLVATNTYAARGTVTRQTSGKGLFASPPKVLG